MQVRIVRQTNEDKLLTKDLSPKFGRVLKTYVLVVASPQVIIHALTSVIS